MCFVENDKPKRRPRRCCFSRESRIMRPVETIPIRKGQLAICSRPAGEIIRSSSSSQTFLWVSHRAQGIPSLSIISVCHCSQSVAGAKMTIGFCRCSPCPGAGKERARRSPAKVSFQDRLHRQAAAGRCRGWSSGEGIRSGSLAARAGAKSPLVEGDLISAAGARSSGSSISSNSTSRR